MKSKKLAKTTARTASKPTARDQAMKKISENPRFKVVRPSGTGFVIGGARPVKQNGAAGAARPVAHAAVLGQGAKPRPIARPSAGRALVAREPYADAED